MFKRKLLVICLVAVVATLFTGCTVLQSKTSYQGQLTDSAGAPVADGNYQMTFRLYDADNAAVGASLWRETQTVSVKDGLFHVSLGATEPITTALFAQKLWLGVEVEGDGEMTPRQELTGSPYAMSLVAGAGIQGVVNKDDPLPSSLNVYNAGTGYGVGVMALGEAAIALDGANIGQNGLLVDNFTHAAVITSTDGTGLQVYANGGGTNDEYGVWGNSQIGDGVFGWGFGTGATDTGITGRSEDGYGVYGFSVNNSWGFYTPDDLYVGGGCTGCTLRYIGYNAADVTLQPGDSVRVVGVDTLEGMSTPVMQVAPAASGSHFLGVVVGFTEMLPVEPGIQDAQPGVHFGAVGGQAAPGEYLIIAVQGPAQVRAAHAGIQAGDLVYPDSTGVTAEATGQAVGLALDDVDDEGLVWVLVGFR